MLTMRQRIAVTATVRNRYRKAAKKEKTRILTELVKTTGYNRSYARYLLGSFKKRGRKKKYPPREKVYDIEVFRSLRELWLIADCICGQRLAPFLPELMRKMDQFGELKTSPEVREKLLTIGSATIDRMLSATKRRYRLKNGRGHATTKPGTLLKQSIPIRRATDWDENKPGFFETDLVAFCGESPRGEYVNGLNLTDPYLGWVLLDAVMGKAQSRVFTVIDRARKRLVYSMLGLDPDNGSEFINWELKRYCDQQQLVFTRIRAGQKNDNCFVEQKNYTVLRRFLGYARYDQQRQLEIIRQALPLIEDYVNFFQPSLKLKNKTRVGSQVKKSYHPAKTPYQRLLESGILNKKQKEKLSKHYESLNPVRMKKQIEKLINKLQKTLRWKIRDLTNTRFR